jgi:hypothetical protein
LDFHDQLKTFVCPIHTKFGRALNDAKKCWSAKGNSDEIDPAECDADPLFEHSFQILRISLLSAIELRLPPFIRPAQSIQLASKLLSRGSSLPAISSRVGISLPPVTTRIQIEKILPLWIANLLRVALRTNCKSRPLCYPPTDSGMRIEEGCWDDGFRDS